MNISIDKLLTTVDSKYKLVYVVAKRSHQMQATRHYQMKPNEYKSSKNISLEYIFMPIYIGDI